MKFGRNWGRLGMKSELSDICSYRKEKIAVAELDRGNYISTENMLPDKNGVTTATSLPTTIQTQKYAKGDILVSNIRPYFKKIWFADKNGGCSNDVLVFKTKEGTDPRYLYYVLANDPFFEYSMATAKGTKMPRGDKKALMEYEVPDYDLKEQNKIAGVLSAIDDKIQLNTKINKNLAEQIKTICTAWLSDYAPFGGILPNDWSEMSLSSIADFVNGYSYKGTELTESNIAMATIKNFDRKGGFKLDGYKEIIPSNKLKDTQHAELFDTLVAHTDLTQNAEVIGNAEPVMSKSGYDDIVFSMDLVKVVPKSKHISKFLIAAILQDKKFKAHCLGYVNGTTVLHLSKKALPEYQLYLPDDLSVLKPLDELVTALYQRISANIEEIIKLETLRDTLLPKLMSGELDVSNIDL